MSTLEKVQTLNLLELSEKYPHLECDGLTNIISYTLKKNSIHHQVYRGSFSVKDEFLVPHFWIDFNSDDVLFRIDYRVKMWMPNPKIFVPHGIFAPVLNAQWKYDGTPRILLTSDIIYRILTKL